MEPMFDLEAFARRLRVAMAALNINQADAAKQIGIPPSIISRICGVHGRPNLETYARIVAWLERTEKREAAK